MIRAVIDLGTNTFQLLIGELEIETGSWSILENRTYAVALGLGAMETGLIQEEAKARAFEALVYFSKIIQNYSVTGVSAIGTSVIRNAQNGGLFLEEISQKFGFDCQMISGEREAELIFLGVVESMPQPWLESSLVMDIGGGSTEFILFEGRKIQFKTSIDIGGLKLLSLFGKNQVFELSQKTEIAKYVSQKTEAVQKAIEQFQPNHLIGAAGAFETLYDLECAREKELMEFSNSHAKELSIEIFHKHMRLLEGMSLSEREKYPGMKPFRAGILPFAMIEIDQMLKLMKNSKLWFSAFSLKEGYFFESLRNSYTSS